MDDIISAEIIKSLLPDKLSKNDITVLSEVDSTNVFVKREALAGAKEGRTVIALHQTAGKGRLGRTFFSPFGTGIYMSLLLRPLMPLNNAVLITSAAAVAVCKALEKEGICPQIKWVNDIFLNSKKICGILTESSLNIKGGINFAVLGIGINVYPPKDGFFGNLEITAGSAFKKSEENLRNRITADILTEFFKIYENLPKVNHLDYYKEHCFVLGKEITVIKGETEKKAKALDIDENFRLLVDYGDKTELLSSGEISIRF